MAVIAVELTVEFGTYLEIKDETSPFLEAATAASAPHHSFSITIIG